LIGWMVGWLYSYFPSRNERPINKETGRFKMRKDFMWRVFWKSQLWSHRNVTNPVCQDSRT